MEDKREIRAINDKVNVVGESESRRVEGYAMLFNTKSDGLDFEETILPTAMDGVLDRSNVFALLNHDSSRGILARSKSGTLSLTVDAKGLRYSFDAPKTQLGDELLEYLKRGEINSSSFAFTVEKDTWERKKDGSCKRTIEQIDRLYDVSPVYDAAYSKTSVCKRGLEQLQESEKRAEEEAEKLEKNEKKTDLSGYFEEINCLINNF